MKKLLAGLLALCLLLALSACGNNSPSRSEADLEDGTYPVGMDPIYITEPEPSIDFGEKDFSGDLNFEDAPIGDGEPLEDI